MSDELDLRTEEQTPPAAEPANNEAARERRELPPPSVRTVDTTAKPAAHELPFKKSVIREYFESAVVTLIMALFGMTFIVQAVRVPTGSMKNTIYIGDHLLVNKFLFGSESSLKLPILPARDIRRGDVIVFKYPKKPLVNYVKRVIGLPGDTVEFNPKTNRVYVNGKELPEHRELAEYQVNTSPDPLEARDDEGAPPGAWYTVFYQDPSGSYDATARWAV